MKTRTVSQHRTQTTGFQQLTLIAAPAVVPDLSSPDSSVVTPAPVLMPDGLLHAQPLVSSSAGPAPHNLPRAGKDVDIAALLAGSSINLGLLSSILLSGISSGMTKTISLNPTIIITLSYPHPAPSATHVSSVLATATTSAPLAPSKSIVLPTTRATSSAHSGTSVNESLTSPPSSYNPSMSRSLEPSSASAEGHTPSTSSTSSSPTNTEIPPAPLAAGASGGMGTRGKERVWWVIFFTPFMLLA